MHPSFDVRLSALPKAFRAIASALANEFIIPGFPPQIDAHLSALPSGIDNSPELPMALTGAGLHHRPPCYHSNVPSTCDGHLALGVRGSIVSGRQMTVHPRARFWSRTTSHSAFVVNASSGGAPSGPNCHHSTHAQVNSVVAHRLPCVPVMSGPSLRRPCGSAGLSPPRSSVNV